MVRCTRFMEWHSLEESGCIRERADKYIEAVFAAPSVWTECRFDAFESYLSIVCDSGTETGATPSGGSLNNISLHEVIEGRYFLHELEIWIMRFETSDAL